jgi:alkyl hydroperoxide reductase subunit F
MDEPYDLMIIGGGPAGLTAAVYASILRMKAFLITHDLGGQALDGKKISNYMGFDFITGPELIEKFQSQLLEHHYIDHHIGTVTGLEKRDGRFRASTDYGRNSEAAAVLIATGMHRRRLNIPGEEAFQRRGIFYRLVQDASMIAGTDVTVVGGGNSGLQAVYELSGLAKTVHLVSDFPLVGDPEQVQHLKNLGNLIEHIGFTVSEIRGDERVASVVIESLDSSKRKNLSVSAVFVEIGLLPNSGFVSHLVKLNERGEIMIGPDCTTSCPGIFAAGDVTDAFGKRIIIASGEGAKAALAAREYILANRNPVKNN